MTEQVFFYFTATDLKEIFIIVYWIEYTEANISSISAAHSDEDIERTIEGNKKGMKTL